MNEKRSGLHEEEARPAWSRPTGRLVCATGVTLLALWIVRDYLIVLAWAAIITVTVWPVYYRAKEAMPKRMRESFLPPLGFTIVTGVLLLVPLGVAAYEVGRDAQLVMASINEVQQRGIPVPGWVEAIPLIGRSAVGWWDEYLGKPGGDGLLSLVKVSSLADLTKSFGAELLNRLLLFSLTLMALFFFFRDGETLGDRVFSLADRWLGDPGELLAERLVEAVRSTVNGTVLVALGEAVLIYGGYVLTGVPHAAIFGVLTAGFALMPLGAWFAFAVASLVLVFEGQLWSALALFVGSAAIMMIGDNFVQPALVGKSVRMPFLVVLLGILGGLQTFGLIGLFLGPVVMAALLTLWREWPVAPARADPP